MVFMTGANSSKNRAFLAGAMVETMFFCIKIRFLRLASAIAIPGIEHNKCTAIGQLSINTKINTNFVGGQTLWAG